MRFALALLTGAVGVAGLAVAADSKPQNSGGQGLHLKLEGRETFIRAGEKFLASLFDPELGLLPEFRGSKTYWLFHDNYLAARALAETEPGLSRQIQTALRKFGVTNSGKIEILFAEARQPLPFRTYQLTNVAVLNGKKIRTEIVTSNVMSGWEQYADLLLLASIAETGPAQSQARSHFDQAAAMWDGKGFNDRAAKAMDVYSTYKLALFLIAAQRLDLVAPHADQILARLLYMQGKDGGWITDYNNHDQPVGLANVETTCLALLALKSLPR